MNEEKIKKIFRNRDVLKWVILGLAGFAILVLVFGAGVKVGTLKARYSYRWADNYHKNFAGPRGGFLGDWRKFPAGDYISGHGIFGEIIELTKVGLENTFVVRGRNNVEKVVITTPDTVVKKGTETMKDYLKVGKRVVILGSPNEEGQIEAKLIRVFDEETKGWPSKRPRPRPFF